MISSIAQNVINVTDTAFLGRLDNVALAAGALGGLFYLAIIQLGWGVGIGAQIIVARRYGEGNTSEIGPTINQVQIFLLFLASLLVALYQVFGHALLTSIVRSDQILKASLNFLDYRIWGLFFTFSFFSLRGFFVGIAETTVITYTTFTMVLVNVFLGYSLIFGHFGLPKMGIKGAGLASTIAEFSGVVTIILYTVIKKYHSKFYLFKTRGTSWGLLLKIQKISAPLMLQHFLSFSIWFLFFLIIEKMGEIQLAVSNIVRSIYVVMLIPIMGFATAANTLVSYQIGQNRSNEVLSLTWRIAILSAGFSLFLSVICLTFAHPLISIYTTDIYLIENTQPVLFVVAVASIILSVAFVLFNGVTGTGKTNISLAIEIVILFFYILLTWFIALVMKGELYQVWIMEIVYGILLSVCSLFYLKSNRWIGMKV